MPARRRGGEQSRAPLRNPSPPADIGTRAAGRRPWLAWLAAALLAALPPAGAAQAVVVSSADKVEAAYLRNFARYVGWPAHAFADERAPWSVCILGSDRFDGVLEQTLQGRVEQGRRFEVARAPTLEQLPRCHIVFVGHDSAVRRRAALDQLSRWPVLTVGEAPEFLHEGGIVRFQVGQHVEMSINLDQARATSLKIPAKMLEVARDVLENGALRRLR